MANTFTTLADVAVFDNIDADLDVSDVLDDAPTIAVVSTLTTDGRTFTYERKTANPVTGFRAANTGRDLSNGAHEEKIIGLTILDASTAIDWAVASADKRGQAVRVAMEIEENLRSAFFSLENQFWRGVDAANGFPGMTQLLDAVMTLPDDTLTTGQLGAPLWALRLGPNDCNLVLGEHGKITVGDTMIQDFIDAGGKHYPAVYTPITSWVGAMAGSIYSVGAKIVNADLDDDDIADLWSKFPSGRKPHLIATTREGLAMLQKSRTATNPTGAPAPFPAAWSGAGNIPIITTEGLLNTVGA